MLDNDLRYKRTSSQKNVIFWRFYRSIMQTSEDAQTNKLCKMWVFPVNQGIWGVIKEENQFPKLFLRLYQGKRKENFHTVFCARMKKTNA